MNKLRNLYFAIFCATAVFVLDAGAAPSMSFQSKNENTRSQLFNTLAPAEMASLEDFDAYQSQVKIFLTEALSTKYVQFPAIPAGKQLIIEHVSARGFVQPGQKPMVWLKLNSYEYTLEMNHQVSYPNGKDYYAASQPMKLYVDSTDNLYASVSRWSNTGDADFLVSISGYLVDAP